MIKLLRDAPYCNFTSIYAFTHCLPFRQKIAPPPLPFPVELDTWYNLHKNEPNAHSLNTSIMNLLIKL